MTMSDTALLTALMWVLLVALVAGLIPVAGWVAAWTRRHRVEVTARLELLLALPLEPGPDATALGWDRLLTTVRPSGTHRRVVTR